MPDGQKQVLKDVRGRPLLARLIWCRRVMRRECAAYERLAKLDGVPHVVRKLGRDAFIMSFVDGSPLPSRRTMDNLSPHYFEKLKALVHRMHELGVAHGDLRRRNILLSSDGQPAIIDFETATFGASWFSAWVFRMVRQVDEITVLKIENKYFPGTLNAQEHAVLDQVPWFLRWGRYLRRNVYGRISPKRMKRREYKQRRKEPVTLTDPP